VRQGPRCEARAVGLWPRSLEFGDLILLPGAKAGAIPPDFIVSPAQKQSVFPALGVGLEVADVSACRRENITGRGASVPGLVAVLEARLATIGAIAGGFLKRGKPGHD
jgi:hypothetical protein